VAFLEDVETVVGAQLQHLALLLPAHYVEVDVELGNQLLESVPLVVLLDRVPKHDYSCICEERLLSYILLQPHTLPYLLEVPEALLQHLLGF